MEDLPVWHKLMMWFFVVLAILAHSMRMEEIAQENFTKTNHELQLINQKLKVLTLEVKK